MEPMETLLLISIIGIRYLYNLILCLSPFCYQPHVVAVHLYFEAGRNSIIRNIIYGPDIFPTLTRNTSILWLQWESTVTSSQFPGPESSPVSDIWFDVISVSEDIKDLHQRWAREHLWWKCNLYGYRRKIWWTKLCWNWLL